MDFLTKIYSDIEAENNNELKNANKAALYTLVNFLEAYDGFVSEQEMKKRFLYRQDFSFIFQKLIQSEVVESKDGFYKFNKQAKDFISPILEDLMTILYKSEKKVSSSDPSLQLLYNCRSQVFSS